MRRPPAPSFTLGAWTIRPEQNLFERGGMVRRVEPMTMRLALFLAANGDRTVSRDAIVEELWQGRIVSDDAITKQISKLRAALDDDPRDPTIVRTIPKVGVRLIATASPPTARSDPEPGTPSISYRRWLVALAVGLAIGAALWLARREEPMQLVERPLTTLAGMEVAPAISPDGRWLAYAGRAPGETRSGIYVRMIDEDRPRRISAAGADADNPAWSSVGKLAYIDDPNGRCGIMVGTMLGEFRRVADCVAPLGLAWRGEAQLVIATHAAPGASYRLELIDLASGRVTPLTTPPPGTLGDRSPTVSPDGSRVYFARSETVGVEHLLELQLASGALRTVSGEAAHVIGLAAAGDGLVVATNHRTGVMALWWLDLARGTWRQLTTAISGAPSANADGHRIVVAREERRMSLWRAPLAGGAGAAVTDTTMQDWLPALAPDGTLAFLSTRSGSRELWSGRPGRPAERLTRFNGPEIQDPAWSPDSRHVALAVPASGNFDLYIVNAETRALQRITIGVDDDRHPAFSVDGRTLYFSRRSGERFRLMQRELLTGRESALPIDGLRPIVAPHGGGLYFSRLFTPGLFRFSFTDRRVTRLADWPRWDDMRNWTIANGAIWGIRRDADDRPILMKRDLATGYELALGPLTALAQPSGLAVGQNALFYARLMGLESDLSLIERH